ncbi:MAG: LysM peptidoglycan-binding domain-containing protein [Rickettsiales bacterium]|nr:LysM peptidoglycan-binding domain-containing protein [Rickettsiales bacterium]
MFAKIRGYFANFGRTKKGTEDLIDVAIKRQRGLRRGGFLDPRYWAKGLRRLAFVQPTPAPVKRTPGRKKAAAPMPPQRARLSAAGWLMILMLVGLVAFLFMRGRDEPIAEAMPSPEPVAQVEPAADVAAEAPAARKYIVKKGDWLSKISKRYYGSARRVEWRKIQSANGISNPNVIEIGDVLAIPE